VEHWLNKQKWYSHDSGIPHKIILALCFNKKRPSMIPNFIIPSEYEMLDALSKNAGVAGLNCNAKSFIQDKKLKIVWDSKQMPHTEVFYYRAK
jgi:hypothetical protein